MRRQSKSLTANQSKSAAPQPVMGKLNPGKSLLGTLLLLLMVGGVIAAGGGASSILISKNEDLFTEKGDHYSYLSSISYSGRFVSFDSKASNLDQDVPDDYAGWDIFLMDRDINGNDINDEVDDVDTILVTPGANADSRYPMLARKPGINMDLEKRYVVFQSDSTFFNAYNWIPHDPPIPDEQWDPGFYTDIFLADLVGYSQNPLLSDIRIYPVSCAIDYGMGEFSNGDSGSPGPIPTSLGNPIHAGAVVYLENVTNKPFVVFESSATNLIAGGTGSYQHIYVRDVSRDCRETGVITLLSKTTDDVEANGHSTNPVVSSDGRFVAFVSYATNLVDGPDGSKAQVYLLDRLTSQYYLLSSDQTNFPGNGDSFSPSIGKTGSGNIRVVFSSDASNLVDGDTNGFRDIFMAEIVPGGAVHTIELVSYGITGEQGNNLSTAPVISGDGLMVSFTSYATNLVYNDNNYDCFEASGQINCPDIFSRAIELGNEFIWRTSLTSAGEQTQANSGATQLDGTGKYASFVTFADLIGSGTLESYQQVYVRDHGTPPGNPIISPTSWKFIGVRLDDIGTREFTLTFLGELQINTIYIDLDTTHFSIIADDCSGHTFYENDTCTFTVQYTTSSPNDELGDSHSGTVAISLVDDPRGELYIAVSGYVSMVSYNPLVMID